MRKITKEQRLKWLEDNRCHICGSNEDNHTHPNWMWLAYPVPEEATGERAEIERELNNATLSMLIGFKYEKSK